MPTIKDADGKDIEVFTADEVKKQTDDAIAVYAKDHPDQSAVLSKAQTDLKAATDALATATAGGGDDKDKNFGALRAAVKAAEDNAVKIKTEMTTEIEKIRNAPNEEFQSDLLARLSGGNKETKEKIEIRYKELSGMPATNKAEVRARMDAAFKLATDQDSRTILDGRIGAGARGDGGMPVSTTQENDNSRAIRGALGISDDQAKKFAPRPGQPGYQS